MAWLVLGLGFNFNLHAAPVLLAQPSAPNDSLVNIVAEAQGLALVPPDQVPPTGTFWWVQANGVSAPLPCPPADSSGAIYQIASGQYLVDTTDGQVALPPQRLGVRVSAAAVVNAQADALANQIDQIQAAASQQMSAMFTGGIPSPGGGGGSGGSGDYSPANTLITIDTNRLWLQMITVTNQTASLVAHPPWNVSNQVYDLLYTTNLASQASWRWLLRSYPNQTNLIVPNAADPQGLYRLSSPNDPTANSSLGTNFWLAFCGLSIDYSRGNRLSLIISSPAGASGRVTTPSYLTNGPILLITNCGDAGLNGIYVLTNLTSTEQTALGNNYIDANSPTYVKGTNWVAVDASGSGQCVLVAYDSDTGGLTYLYVKPGGNLNGGTNDWLTEGDPNLPVPTSLCAQVPLVDQSFTVAAGAATNISLPLAAMMTDYDAGAGTVETNGIHLTASQPVSVYGMDYDATGSAAFTGYPTPLLGTNYCVMARAADNYAGNSELAILATQDDTTVTIIPSPTANLSGYFSTNAYQVNLQAGETYQARSASIDDDVTGTWIISDKPVAVFGGASVADVPDGNTQSGNPLVQEQLPVESWGKEALAMSLAGRTNGDTYRILAAYSNTVVTIKGKVVTILDETDGPPWSVTTSNETVVVTNQAGQFYDIIVDGPVEFQATEPIQIAQFANGCNFDYIPDPTLPYAEGDPGEILVPLVGHYLNTNIIVTLPNDGVNGDFDENYLNIIVVQSGITSTVVDGSIVARTNFIAIGTSGYYGAQFAVTNSGVHTVTSSQPVGVQTYGFGVFDAYSFCGSVVK